MARITLGVGTSHSPMLSMSPETWLLRGRVDQTRQDLVDPETGKVVSYAELEARRMGANYPLTYEVFKEQWNACQ